MCLYLRKLISLFFYIEYHNSLYVGTFVYLLHLSLTIVFLYIATLIRQLMLFVALLFHLFLIPSLHGVFSYFLYILCLV